MAKRNNTGGGGSDSKNRGKRISENRARRTQASSRTPRLIPNASGDGGFNGAPF